MSDSPQKTYAITPRYVHLRVHSAYSLSEGAIPVKEAIALSKKFSMPAVALTDTNNLFGSLEFSQAASSAGVQPIIGCQLSFKPICDSSQVGKNASAKTPCEQLSLYAKNETGYYNLLKLVSKAYLNPPEDAMGMAMLAYEDLDAHKEGIIVLTGSIHGAVGRFLLAKKEAQAENFLLRLSNMFKDSLYVELQRHNLPEEQRTEPDFIALAQKHNLPVVATNDAYFTTRDKAEAHDALLCVAGGTYVAEENRRRLNGEFYFKSQDEMAQLFADIPEALANTVHIAQRCAVLSPKRAPILPSFVTDEQKSQGYDEAAVLREQSREGLEYRLKAHVYTEDMNDTRREEIAKPYWERLEFELDIIIQMGFPGYFLIVSDFIKWSKEHDIPVGPGRGSGAGSIVAWSLLITDLDPLRYGLLFERFLNPERVSMPDFDVDFCQDRRDEVIRYVQNKYGYDQVAQIITFGKLQARAVLRDVGRVLQMPYGQVDRISKMVPNNPAQPCTLQQAIDIEPMLRQARRDDEAVEKLLHIALQLEGLYRHASTHAAGVVIGDRKLDELVPMYRDAKSDMPVVQYSMKYAESAGLVKFDFLGLKTLSVLKNATDFIKLSCGDDIDLLTIPEGDPASYEMLSRGETVGVFQFESVGMRDSLYKLKPDCLEDLIAMVSLYRPGPMDNIPSYIARKHGKEEPDYMHPMLEEVLKETHGVIIYQEQVQKIAQVMGGYTLGGADLLRRAMGKKIKEEMDAQRVTFTEGAVKNKVSEKQASQIFDHVAKFAGYGFNKSHAAAYALVAYQTAYLKANYPVEFLAASMNYDLNNTDKLAIFRQEVKRLGIEMLPPDVNMSQPLFSVEVLTDAKGKPVLNEKGEQKRAIRYGLAALKNVGESAMAALVAERTASGKFKDVFGLVGRVDSRMINRRALENLIKAGALDSLNPNRQQLLESVDTLLSYSATLARERESNQVSLFGDAVHDMPKPALRELKDWPPLERLHHEFSAVGFYLSSHPLEGYARNLKRMGIVSSSNFSSRLTASYSMVKLAGIVTGVKTRVSDKGKFAFVQLSDVDGIFEVSIFDETMLSSNQNLLENGQLLLVQAEGKMDEGGLRLIVQGLSALDEAVLRAQRGEVHIYVDGDDEADQLKTIIDSSLSTSKQSGVQIKFYVDWGRNERVIVALDKNYHISPTTIANLEALDGIAQVVEV
ncbi:MAG: DNA polymerase III subunit alpha [Alphaproteobacteria bacterium]|nr:DNA polymerase III subunit alpha [Alphaproteobacteria bacterium]